MRCLDSCRRVRDPPTRRNEKRKMNTKRKRRIFPLVSVLFLLLSLSVTAESRHRYVSSSQGDDRDGQNDCLSRAAPCLTLQHAANVAEFEDHLKLMGGPYTRTGGYPLLRIAGAKHLTIRGSYGSAWEHCYQDSPRDCPRPTVFDGQGQVRIAHLSDGAFVHMDKVILTGGRSEGTDDPASGWGGCILAESGSTIRLSDVVVEDCYSEQYGGAVAAWEGGEVRLYWTEISNNQAEVAGAGVAVHDGELSVYRSEFHGNVVDGLFCGGGIYIGGDATGEIEASRFTANRAIMLGGAIFAHQMSGPLVLKENRFGTGLQGNVAGIAGGAVALNRTVASFDGDTFVGNEPEDIWFGDFSLPDKVCLTCPQPLHERLNGGLNDPLVRWAPFEPMVRRKHFPFARKTDPTPPIPTPVTPVPTPTGALTPTPVPTPTGALTPTPE
ncbi:hypothetical protein ACFLZP_04045, partial [Patescibacteria group bacterium]